MLQVLHPQLTIRLPALLQATDTKPCYCSEHSKHSMPCNKCTTGLGPHSAQHSTHTPARHMHTHLIALCPHGATVPDLLTATLSSKPQIKGKNPHHQAS
jgi:hypothetical protein